MKNIKIIEIKSEVGAGTRGSSLGIEALKAAALDAHSTLFKQYGAIIVEDINTALLEKNKYPYAKFIEAITAMEERICTAVYNSLQDNQLPLIISGDHSSAYGSIAGIKKANSDKKLGVIWIDAHADLHSPYTTPSGHMHGMPLAMAACLDNMANKVNEPDEKTCAYWQKIKDIGLPGAKLDLKDVVYIAARSIEKQERHLMDTHGMRSITVEQMRVQGAKACAHTALDALQECNLIYISFDVDSISMNLSEGTGTPVPNGITFEEAAVLNEELVKTPKLAAWEVTEINPLLDTKNKMAKRVLPIVEKVATELAERQKL